MRSTWKTPLLMAGTAAIAGTLLFSLEAGQAAPPNGAIGLFGLVGPGHQSAGHKFPAGPRLTRILENASDGEEVSWTNDDLEITYRIRLIAFPVIGQKTCRVFSLRRTSNAAVRQSHRTACREAQGNWHVVLLPALNDETTNQHSK